jgi:hypothetical protein
LANNDPEALFGKAVGALFVAKDHSERSVARQRDKSKVLKTS